MWRDQVSTDNHQQRTEPRPKGVGYLLLVVCVSLCSAEVTVDRQGDLVRISIADSHWAAVDMVMAIREKFGIPLCIESPTLIYSGDLTDVSLKNDRLRKGTFVPRKQSLTVSFLAPNGSADLVVKPLLSSINEQLTVKYRLDTDVDRFMLIPAEVRDRTGKLAPVRPLLDLEVSIPQGARSIAAIAGLMSQDLSKQTGMTISCCQSGIGGYPWGMEEITFGTPRMPAREVLKHLIRYAKGRNLWISRCDQKFCFIDLY